MLREREDILPFGNELKDFSDTAALVSNLDLVVSVDTSVAHLADFERFSANDIRAQIDVHLMGTIWMCRAVWPHMRRLTPSFPALPCTICPMPGSGRSMASCSRC